MHEEARKIFNQLLDEGIDANEIITALSSHADHLRQTGEIPKGTLADWLKARGWEQHRH